MVWLVLAALELNFVALAWIVGATVVAAWQSRVVFLLSAVAAACLRATGRWCFGLSPRSSRCEADGNPKCWSALGDPLGWSSPRANSSLGRSCARGAIPRWPLFVGTGEAGARPKLRPMMRFLAIYHGAADQVEKGQLSEDQQVVFMNAWATWAQSHQHSLVDPGAPLYRKKLVSARGVEDFTDSKTGYAIVEVGSHEEAVQIFAQHPHLLLHPENSIEVLECPAAPGQAD